MTNQVCFDRYLAHVQPPSIETYRATLSSEKLSTIIVACVGVQDDVVLRDRILKTNIPTSCLHLKFIHKSVDLVDVSLKRMRAGIQSVLLNSSVYISDADQ